MFDHNLTPKKSDCPIDDVFNNVKAIESKQVGLIRLSCKFREESKKDSSLQIKELCGRNN